MTQGASVGFVAFLLMTGTAMAQVPPGFASERLQVGRKVAITDEQGDRITGRVTQLTADAITIEHARAARGVPFKQIVRVEEVDDLKNGMLVGLGIGVALFTLEAILARSDGFELTPAGYAVIGSIYAGLGAGAGAGIDALVGGNRTIYRRNGSGRVSVAPTLRPDRAGVGLVFSW